MVADTTSGKALKEATISDLLAEVKSRTGASIGGRAAKKIRKEVRKLQGELSQDLKAWIRRKGFPERCALAYKIIVGRNW
jgi:hypothetical protein